jgi:2-hydroxy-6-oxonona-2,4-dienedioate hydrolase
MDSQKINRYRSSENALFRAYHLEPKEERIRIENLGTLVRVQTIGTGVPLLFVHGAPNAGSTWAQLVSFLPGYKCILIDRPGCGLSDAISYKNISPRDIADIIVSVIDRVLDYFNIDKAPVISSSFGGYLVLLYTLQKPKRISKLIFEGCPAMVEGSGLPPFMKIMLAPVLNKVIPRLPTTKLLFKIILRKLGHGYSVAHRVIPEVFVDWYVSLFNNTDTQRNDISLAGKAFHAGNMKPEFILHDTSIENISQPTLWLWGRDDPFGGIEVGNRLKAKMKNASILVFNNSGHLPWIDGPEEHAKKINEFLIAA